MVDLVLVCPFLKQLDPPEEEQLSAALQSVEAELGKLGEIPWLYHILQPNDEEVSKRMKTHKNKKKNNNTETHAHVVTISNIV